jgi:thiamine-phosphate pyrophosphorylase
VSQGTGSTVAVRGGGLPNPCLVLITDRRRSALPLLDAVAAGVEAGVDAVQLREPDLPRADLLELARALRAITAGRALLLINGDLELALAVGADGVHLSERAPAVGGLRAQAGQRLVVGRSVHSVAAARRAVEEGVDYVQVGAVYATASHPGRAPVGLALVREARAAISMSPGVRRAPLLAIGGITPENAGEVLAAGADGLAVIGAILGSERPGAVVRRFCDVLASAAGE